MAQSVKVLKKGLNFCLTNFQRLATDPDTYRSKIHIWDLMEMSTDPVAYNKFWVVFQNFIYLYPLSHFSNQIFTILLSYDLAQIFISAIAWIFLA